MEEGISEDSLSRGFMCVNRFGRYRQERSLELYHVMSRLANIAAN